MGNNPSSPTVTFTNLAYTIVPGDIINIAFIDLSNVNPNVWRIGSIGAFAYAGSYFQILCPGANTVCYGINTIPVQWTPSYSSTTPQIFNVSFNGRTLTSVYSRIQAPANSVPNSLYLQWNAIYNQGQACVGNTQPCSGQGTLAAQAVGQQAAGAVGISPPIQMATVTISRVNYYPIPNQTGVWIMVAYFNSLPCNGINKTIAYVSWTIAPGVANISGLCPGNNTIIPYLGTAVNIRWGGQPSLSSFSAVILSTGVILQQQSPSNVSGPCTAIPPIIFQASQNCGQTMTDNTGLLQRFFGGLGSSNSGGVGYQGVSNPSGAGYQGPNGNVTRTTYYPANAPDLTVLTFPNHGTLHAFAVNGNSATHLPPNQPTMIGRYALHWDGRVVHAKYGGVSITSRSESISMHATTMQQLSAIPMGSTNAMPGVNVNSAQPTYAKPITQPRYALTPNDNNMTIDASRRDMVVEFPDSLPEGMQVQITRVDASKHKVKLPALAGRKDNLYLNTCDCHKSIQLQKRGGAWGVL